MHGIADELASVLFGLDLGGLPTGRTTAHITRAIVGWALARGWLPLTEVRVLLAGAGAELQTGYIDVVIHRSPGEADVAIEIDSTDKAWSLAKLRHAAQGGMHAIWIRWGDEEWSAAQPDVDVIQLPARRRSAPRQAGDQLTVW